MKFLRLLLIAALCPLSLLAQSNFKPAYIVKLNGDTLKGYINYREWELLPEVIEFKNNVAEKQATKYEPAQISSFGITNMDKYVSYTGNISADDNVFPNLPSQLDTTTVRDTIFLQLLYQGSPLSLYSHRDSKKIRYFVQENAQQPAELKYHQYYAQTQQISTFAPYGQQLFNLAGKYNPEFKNAQIQIERSKFNESDILRIVKSINNDKSKEQSGTIGSDFYVGLMLNRTVTSFEGQNVFDGKQSVSYVPRVAAGFDFYTNKYTQKIVLRMELTLAYLNASFSSANRYNDFYTYKFNQYSASIGPQVLYNIYNSDKFKFYLGVGASVNLAAYANDELRTAATNIQLAEESYYSLTNYYVTTPLKAGVILNKKLDISATYIRRAPFTNYVAFDLGSTLYGLSVNYRLGK
ncbi:hypothetical protein [uncultured Mucilaginibacter sp.]|uniref:hypothetical protein n=1 Tax=uncultured Mucilaginibacter sp. TaxID=797541 RepID=UPI0025F86F36|nr:hypothetical protein [uncultured Mucilaginibacter sp.]